MKTFEKKSKMTTPPVRRGRTPVLPSFNPAAQIQRAQIRQVLRSPQVQAKLAIGQPNDKYEQEADRVADEVMRMPEPEVQRQVEPEEEEEETLQPKPLAEQITPLVQRQVEPEEEEEEPIQTKQVSTHTPAVTPNLASRIQSLRGGGQPLPKSARSFFEPRFGLNFSHVQIHNNPEAAEIARTVNAKAFTIGRNIIFGSMRYSSETHTGKKLLAHELTHVLQQNNGKDIYERPPGDEKTREQALYAKCCDNTMQCQSGKEQVAPVYLQRTLGNWVVRRLMVERIQRDPPEQATPTEAEYRAVVRSSIVLFTMANRRYRLSPVSASLLTLAALFREEWQERSGASGLLANIVRFLQSLIEAMQRAISPEGLLLEIRRILTGWRGIYDAVREIITGHLAGNAALSDLLRSRYQAAIEALHRSVRDRTPRVSINIIAAPPAAGDDFIANATAYAQAYFESPQQDGDEVETAEGIASPSALLDTVQSTRPERMIRRVDIFAHGTINPTNQIRFGPTWYTVADIEAAAQGRQYESRYIQSVARFDDRSVMEVHACRLGGGTGQHFLEATGRAMGGEHGQSVTGYIQRWYPYRFEVFWTWNNAHGVQVYNERVANTDTDIYGSNALPDRNGHQADHSPFVTRFENYAVQVFDDVVAGSIEVRSFLNIAERAGGAVTRPRKIEIMRAMYDQNGAWLLGFLHPAAGHAPGDARAAEATADYTFTSETADWQTHVLTVSVNPPVPAHVP